MKANDSFSENLADDKLESHNTLEVDKKYSDDKSNLTSDNNPNVKKSNLERESTIRFDWREKSI